VNSFYLHRTNWHSWPPLSRLLCRLGRHDYEFVRTEVTEHVHSDDTKWGILECIYCGQLKKSKGRE
jgi:hypothetical protein